MTRFEVYAMVAREKGLPEKDIQAVVNSKCDPILLAFFNAPIPDWDLARVERCCRAAYASSVAELN